MTVTTTVKGYFHITANSLEVAQTFIGIVNELHPEKYEWSTEIGPGITLWSPRPDDKMCYGIPFQAKGRNDYRKNLIDMLDVIGRKRTRKEIQQLTDEELTIVVTWSEFTTEYPFIARGEARIQKAKGAALYSALLDILSYERKDFTVDLLKQWGFSSWKYADYTRTGITNFMTKFKNNKTVIGDLSQYDIDDLVHFAKQHGPGYIYYLENIDEAHAIEFRDGLLDIMAKHPTTSIVEGTVQINASSESDIRTLVSIFAASDDDPIFDSSLGPVSKYRMKFNRQEVNIGKMRPQMFRATVDFQGTAENNHRYTLDDVTNWAKHRLFRLPLDARKLIFSGQPFWLSLQWQEHNSDQELLTNGCIMWEKPLDQTNLHTTYIQINGPILSGSPT